MRPSYLTTIRLRDLENFNRILRNPKQTPKKLSEKNIELVVDLEEFIDNRVAGDS